MHTVKPQTRTLRTNINSQGNEANITKKPHLHKNILYHASIALCVFAHYVGEKNLFGMYNAFPPKNISIQEEVIWSPSWNHISGIKYFKKMS